MKHHPRFSLTLHFRARFLLALLPPLTAGAQPSRIHTRFISIEKAGLDTAFQALPGSGMPDSRLFESLMSDVAKGTARITADQEAVNTSGQRARVQAASHYPAPDTVSFGSAPGGRFVPPFDTATLGQVFEMEATVSDGPATGLEVRNIDLSLAAESRSLLQRQDCPIPLPDAWTPGVEGPVRLPLFAVQKTATQLVTWTGNTVLLSVSPGPADSLREGEPVFRYQFIRAGLDGEKPAPSGPEWTGPDSSTVQARLHLVTFRLPTSVAISLTASSENADAALFRQLRGMASEGTAVFAGSSALVVRYGHRSQVDSFTEYPILLPAEGKKDVVWENFQMGETLTAELSMSDEKRRVTRTDEGTRVESYREDSGAPAALSWNLAYERNNGLEEIPWHPGEGEARRPGVADVEFLRWNLSTQAVIPESGVLLVGMVSHSPATLGGVAGPPLTDGSVPPGDPPATADTPNSASRAEGGDGDDRSLTDITFALQSPGGKTGGGSSRVTGGTDSGSGSTLESAAHGGQVSCHALMLSMPEAEGRSLSASLKAGGSPLPGMEWLDRARSGAIPCAAQAAVISKVGQRGKASATRDYLAARLPEARAEDSVPPGTSAGPQSGGASPARREPRPAWERARCGFQMEVEVSQAYGKDPDQLEVSLRLDWDTAPLLSLSETAAADSTPRRCHQQFDLQSLPLRLGQSAIVDVRPSNAREGPPEHGRWHALLLIVQ